MGDMMHYKHKNFNHYPPPAPGHSYLYDLYPDTDTASGT